MDWRLDDIWIRADAHFCTRGIGLRLRAFRGDAPVKGVAVRVWASGCPESQGGQGCEWQRGVTDSKGCFEMARAEAGPTTRTLLVQVSYRAWAETSAIAVLPAWRAPEGRQAMERADSPLGHTGAPKLRRGAQGRSEALPAQKPLLPREKAQRAKETAQLRRLVEEHQGDTTRVAQVLGMSRSSLSRKLNGPLHGAWWRDFKASRARRRSQAQQRRSRCRRYFRDLLAYPGQDLGFQKALWQRLSIIGARRGESPEALLTMLRREWPRDPAIASLDELLGGRFGRSDATRIADAICTMATLLGLPEGPSPLYRERGNKRWE